MLVAMPHEVDAVLPQHLAGKVVVSCGVNDERVRAWGDAGVHTIVDAALVLQGHVLSPATLEAMLIGATGHGHDLRDDDYPDMLTQTACSRASSTPMVRPG